MEHDQEAVDKNTRLHPFWRFLAGRRNEATLLEIRRAAKKLRTSRLRGDSSVPLQFKLDDVLPESAPAKLFGYYSADGIAYALRELGILGRAEQIGFKDLQVTVGGDAWRQVLRIHGSAGGKTYLLVEGRFKKTSGPLPGDTLLKSKFGAKAYSLVTIEWFLLQNPLAEFSPDKPQLPGQAYPGLGIRGEVMEVFYTVARRLKLDAYIVNAMLLHNSFIYSPEFFFCNPNRQAELMAIKRDAQGHSLQDLTIAVEGGFVYLQGQEKPYEWTGAPMVRPLSRELSSAYHLCGYRQLVEDMSEKIQFYFDWESFQEHRHRLLEKFLDTRRNGASRSPAMA